LKNSKTLLKTTFIYSLNTLKMVSYITNVAFKSVPRLSSKVTLPVFKSYLPNYILWSGAWVFGLGVYTEGWPLFQQTFFKHIPVFGKHWDPVLDPEDLPN